MENKKLATFREKATGTISFWLMKYL